ncbi:MAG: Kelch repeat-containing protein, partial [Candidatus Limnocylindria bacterium]
MTFAANRRPRVPGIGLAIALAFACIPIPGPSAPPSTLLRWESRQRMSEPRTHFARAVAGDGVVIVGGLLRGGSPSSRVDRYDAGDDRWDTLAPLPLQVDHAMAVAIGDDVFVFGGDFARPSQRSFRFRGGSWEEIAPMPEPRAAGAAVVVGGQVFVIGGLGAGRSHPNATLVFSSATGAWRVVAPIPTAREHLAATVFQDEICALGGYVIGAAPLKVVECYAPSVDRWRTLPPMPRAASDFDAAVLRDTIWTVGDDTQYF